MTELRPMLARMGLEQYFEKLVAEGFDTWNTLCDITEEDLQEMEVKLGHRRKLQRQIAFSRGYGPQQALDASGARASTGGGVDSEGKGENNKPSSQQGGRAPSGKRKYKRHPKPDGNAPDRAPSAYVIFSNQIREDLKEQSLSFTDIAKRVGEQWQLLPANIRTTYEARASAAKDKYRAEIQEYKKTDNYRTYAEYLADFKHKNNGAPRTEEKRPRLHHEASLHSSQSAESQEDDIDDAKPCDHSLLWSRPRGNSFGSLATQSTSGHSSPTAAYALKSVPVAGHGSCPYSSQSPITAVPQNFSSRKDAASSHSRNPSQLQISMEGSAQDVSPAPEASLDGVQARLSPFALGSDISASRSGSMTQHRIWQDSKSSASSPYSYSTQSNQTTAPSSLGSLTSDQRAQRTLPPIPMLGLDVRNSPGRSPLPTQLGPTLKSNFSPSDSSGSSSTRTASTSQPTYPQPPDRQPQANSKTSDQDPTKPSFKGEYDMDAFSTDPLSVLAYAGRMVDNDDRASSGTSTQREVGRRQKGNKQME